MFRVVLRNVHRVLPRKGVGRAHCGAGGVAANQVVVLKEHLQACLLTREALGFLEVDQVFMIHKDCHGMGGASQILAPFRECMYDREEFLIIDVIVSFSGGKCFGEVRTGCYMS